jgi:alpha-tubulin suppressor-like RCC1 family protein
VSAGREHSCGVTLDNRAWCWGGNQRGQLGDGTTVEGRLVPTQVAGGLRFLDVIAGEWHTCGITTDNRAYCWGLDWDGQVGSGSPSTCSGGICRRPVVVAGSRRYRQISTGSGHTCAVTLADKALCWGQGRSGELGDGNALGISRSPVAVRAGSCSGRSPPAGRTAAG